MVNLTVDNFLDGIQMLQTIMVSIMTRAALDDEGLQSNIEAQLGSKLDWSTLKAGDRIRSAKLKAIFKPFSD